jgi:hypothetical protein
MTYTLTNTPNVIVRDEDGAFIPFDEANIDYVEYLAWLDEGNEPTLYTSPPVLPEETPEQVPIQVTTTRTITKGKK